EIPLPERLLRRGWNTIALVPSLRTPREIDPRPLRFAVREVSWDSTRTVGTIQKEELELTKLSTAAGVRILAPGEAMSFALRLPRGTTLGLTCHGMGQASATLEVTGEPVGGGDEPLWSGQVEPGRDPITITETTRHELRGVTLSVGRRSQGPVAITNVTADVPPASKTGKLFLLVTVDGLRSDAVRQGAAALPALHGPAGERIAFLQAYTPSPAVVPCYCSVMTSYYPFVHGILDDGVLGLSDAVPTLASLLSSAGYQCAAVVSDPALSPGTSRLSRGFGHYSSPEGRRHRPAAEVADEAVRTLFAAWPTMRPGFLWLHFSDPASAADSASGAEGRPLQSYERAVAAADSCLGTVLRCLGSLCLDGDLTLLVSAGHGIAAGADDGRRLSHPLSQPVIHVPLMLRLPGTAPTKSTVGFPVSLLDIMPTILALAGVEPPQGIQGTNLLPLVEGQERWRTLFCEAPGGVAVSAVGLPYKLVRATDTESPPAELGDGERLFDLASDPGETLNVLDRRVSKATDMVSEWNALIGSTVTRFRPVPIN
ncbi:MAG: sulfatase-like hydrolase/transferase, partial [Candidatus Eisenbacteria bacterium]|nr:sulfatase-like hydrolase/transferase [Candidatus Eisenbacteria bacterium]